MLIKHQAQSHWWNEEFPEPITCVGKVMDYVIIKIHSASGLVATLENIKHKDFCKACYNTGNKICPINKIHTVTYSFGILSFF